MISLKNVNTYRRGTHGADEKFVVMLRTFIRNPDGRAHWLKISIAAALLAGFLLSWRLWLSSRSYPLTPISDLLPVIPFPLDHLWFLAILALLIGILVLPRPKIVIFILVILAGALSLWDQSRWQTWFLQYLFMLGALGLYAHKRTEEGDEAALNTCRLIVASIYFWSGIQKINIEFVRGVFPWFTAPLTKFLPEFLKTIFNISAAAVPFIETGMGLGLLMPRLRVAAIIAAILMHLFVLFVIGPTGYGWHVIAWPWNIAMILLVLILFKGSLAPPRNILWGQKSFYHLVILTLFGIMPLFNFFDLWDSYPASALYSGNTKRAIILVSDALRDRLPPFVKNFVNTLGVEKNEVNLFNWSLQELGVPPYPEERIYKNIARHLCQDALGPSDVMLTIQGRPQWLTGTRSVTQFQCQDF